MSSVCIWIWMTFKLRERTEPITRHNARLSNTSLKVTDKSIHHGEDENELSLLQGYWWKEGNQTFWAHTYSVMFHSTRISRSDFGSWGRIVKKKKKRAKKKKKVQPVNWISHRCSRRAKKTALTEIFWICDVIVDVFSQHGCSFNKLCCQTLSRLLCLLCSGAGRRERTTTTMSATKTPAQTVTLDNKHET